MVSSSTEESEATADSPKERSAGFTLLELVLAVAIAGLALIGLFQAASTGMFAVNSAARVDEAIDRAQSHLAAFGRTGVLRNDRPGLADKLVPGMAVTPSECCLLERAKLQPKWGPDRRRS
jgi:prepilin-type N-terminal cleavage/methylation domain-containing protein